MRGIVTLAAALALPDGSDGPVFPYRDVILVCAFWVVLSTLVVQGLSLRPLLKRLGLRDDDSVGREIQLARAETARAVLNEIEGGADKPAAELLRREYAARLRSSEQAAGAESSATIAALQRQAVSVQRRALIDLRARAVIGDDAFHVAEEEIDLLELSSDGRVHPDA
jgi:CPA1 family monovalent cation:H+ antiporter